MGVELTVYIQHLSHCIVSSMNLIEIMKDTRRTEPDENEHTFPNLNLHRTLLAWQLCLQPGAILGGLRFFKQTNQSLHLMLLLVTRFYKNELTWTNTTIVSHGLMHFYVCQTEGGRGQTPNSNTMTKLLECASAPKLTKAAWTLGEYTDETPSFDFLQIKTCEREKEEIKSCFQCRPPYVLLSPLLPAAKLSSFHSSSSLSSTSLSLPSSSS